MNEPDEDTGEFRNLLPPDFHPSDLKPFVDFPIPLSRQESTHCCLWGGKTGSYDLMTPSMKNSSIAMSYKINGNLRYYRNDTNYSPRTLVMAYCRPELARAAPGERLRFVARCKRYNCINPWHLDRAQRAKRRGRVNKVHHVDSMRKNNLSKAPSAIQTPHFEFKMSHYMRSNNE